MRDWLNYFFNFGKGEPRRYEATAPIVNQVQNTGGDQAEAKDIPFEISDPMPEEQEELNQ